MTRKHTILSLLTLALLLLPAVSMAASFDPGAAMAQVASTFLTTVSNDAKALAQAFGGTTGMEILAACVAIRLLIIVLPGMIDGDLSMLAADLMKLAVTVFIILSLISEWASGFDVFDRVWSGLDGLIQVVINATGLHNGPAIATSGDPLPSVGQWVVQTAVSAIKDVYQAIWTFTSVPGGHGFMGWIGAEVTGNYLMSVIVALLLIIGVAAVVAIYAWMFFEVFTSWAHIMIALAFGPLLLVFYPLKPDWGKNLVKEVAAGFMSFLGTLFLLVVCSNFIQLAGQNLQSAANQYLVDGATWGAGLGAPSIVALYVLLILIIGYASMTVPKIAVSLVSGSDHFSRHRGIGAAMVGGAVGGGIGAALTGVKKATTGSAAGAAKTAGGKAVGAFKAARTGFSNLESGHTKSGLAAAQARRAGQLADRAARDQKASDDKWNKDTSIV